MEGEDEAEGGDRGREKKEDGEKRKKEREGKGKSREREGETWPLSSKTSWTMEKTNLQTNASVLAWRIPGMGEPDGLLSMGSHRVGHD